MSHLAPTSGSVASSYNSPSSASHAPPPSLLPRLSFTQGLLVGQLSIILALVALIRYLLFEDAPTSDASGGSTDDAVDRNRRRRHFPVATKSSRQTTSSSLLSLSLSSKPRPKSPPPAADGSGRTAETHGAGPTLAALARIPEAVGYDMETAADIDVGWLNVLLAHVWEGYRDDFVAGGSNKRPLDEPQQGQRDEGEEWYDDEADGDYYGEDEEEHREMDFLDDDDDTEHSRSPVDAQRTARDLMEEVLNRPKDEQGKLEFLDRIEVTECLVGSSYPLLSNARVRPRDDQGRVRVELDVDYSDLLSLSLQTALLVNYPRPRFAVLPISLGLRLTRFSGTLALSLTSHPPHDVADANVRSRHSLEMSLHPDFLLDATCSSLVGSRAKLQDIPKIQQLILQRIRQAIVDKVGWPKTFNVELPDLVRRRRPKRIVRRRFRSMQGGRGGYPPLDEGAQALANGRYGGGRGRMAGIEEEDEDIGLPLAGGAQRLTAEELEAELEAESPAEASRRIDAALAARRRARRKAAAAAAAAAGGAGSGAVNGVNGAGPASSTSRSQRYGAGPSTPGGPGSSKSRNLPGYGYGQGQSYGYAGELEQTPRASGSASASASASARNGRGDSSASLLSRRRTALGHSHSYSYTHGQGQGYGQVNGDAHGPALNGRASIQRANSLRSMDARARNGGSLPAGAGAGSRRGGAGPTLGKSASVSGGLGFGMNGTGVNDVEGGEEAYGLDGEEERLVPGGMPGARPRRGGSGVEAWRNEVR